MSSEWQTLAIIMLTFFLSVGSAKAFSGSGSGTEADPYQITSCAQLQEIGSELDAYYTLTGNIDCTGSGFSPIGSHSNPFTGALDGGHNAITGITINTGQDYVGLFSQIGDSSCTQGIDCGVVKGVGLEGVDVTGDWWTGALAGASFGNITECYSTGTVRSPRITGGLVGTNGGYIERSFSSVEVIDTGGAGHMGGLSGSNTGMIRDCYSTGDVMGSNNLWVGGLVGSSGSVSGFGDASIVRSYSTSEVHGKSYVGGLVGYGYSDNDIIDSFSAGKVYTTSADSLGELAGIRSDVMNSYWINHNDDSPEHCGQMSCGVFDNQPDCETVPECTWSYDAFYMTWYCGGWFPSDHGCIRVENEDYFKGDVQPDSQSREPFPSWDFDSVWTEVDSSYPVLKWQGIGGDVQSYEVYGCAELTEAGATYTLQNDIEANTTCISIMADDITLDCNGHNITGVVPRTNSLKAGIESKGFSGTSIINCKVSGFITGINITGDHATLENNIARENRLHGISFNGDYSHLAYNDMNNNGPVPQIPLYGGGYGYGLLLAGNSNTLSNNRYVANRGITPQNPFPGFGASITGNNNTLRNEVAMMNTDLGIGPFGIGISLSGSENTLENITAMYNKHSGIYIKGTGNTITGSDLEHNPFGVFMTSSYGSTVDDSLLGNCSGVSSACLYIHDSDYNIIRHVSIEGSDDKGIHIRTLSPGTSSSNNVIRDVTVSGASRPVYIETNSGSENLNNTFLNCSYGWELVEGDSELIRKWYVDMVATDGSNPVQGATVNMDNEDWSSTETTGLDGYVPRQEVIEYVNQSGTTADKTLQVIASKPNYGSYSWGQNQVTDNMILNDGSEITMMLACTPTNDCTGLECGHVDDGCGTMLDCGSCGQSEACVSNACQP
ncbi:MAG: hypothetical protein DRO99_05170, partial [Candidatus Aenigmatarchaeota archaeon]